MKKICIFILLISGCICIRANAQSSDDLFSEARNLGFNGQRAAARTLCYKALEQSPTYTDIWIFLGRLYAWDDRYDSAQFCLEKAISLSPDYLDAYSALSDVYLWSDQYSAAIKVIDISLEKDSTDQEMHLKKARAYTNLKEYENANKEIYKILAQNPQNEKALALQNTIQRNVEVNRIGLTYDYDYFDKVFDPWHLASLSYSRRTNKLGTLVARVNYAYRFGTSGQQFEMDAYPGISDKMYMYLNVGVGNSGLFPTYRWGASLFRSLPRSFEAELGIRQLQYDSPTWIFTGSVGKYWKNYWFSLRPNYVPNSVGGSFSLNFTTRYYIKDADDFIEVLVGTGVAMEELQVNSGDGSPNGVLLNSDRLRLSYQTLFKNDWWGYLRLGYANEETTFSGYRKNYTISIGFDKAF